MTVYLSVLLAYLGNLGKMKLTTWILNMESLVIMKSGNSIKGATTAISVLYTIVSRYWDGLGTCKNVGGNRCQKMVVFCPQSILFDSIVRYCTLILVWMTADIIILGDVEGQWISSFFNQTFKHLSCPHSSAIVAFLCISFIAQMILVGQVWKKWVSSLAWTLTQHNLTCAFCLINICNPL